MAAKVALVFGASGVSGWSTVRELLRFPTNTTFSRVIAVTNRPILGELLMLDDPRVHLVSGIDLLSPLPRLLSLVRERIPEIRTVTQAYFYAYHHTFSEDFADEEGVHKNVAMLSAALDVLCATAPGLKHFTIQTGTKYYGLVPALISDYKLPATPLSEHLPRVPEPHNQHIFYYPQLDILEKHASTESWSWTEIRPDAIIGYSPIINPMNLALFLGVYLSLFRAVNGHGTKVPFPGTVAGAASHFSLSPSSLASRAGIKASLSDGRHSHSGEAFNIGLRGSFTYGALWSHFAEVFGLIALPAEQDMTKEDLKRWVHDHRDAWQVLEEQHGLVSGVLDRTGIDFLHISFAIPIDRDLDVTRLQTLQISEDMDALSHYCEAWELFAQAKVIPQPVGLRSKVSTNSGS